MITRVVRNISTKLELLVHELQSKMAHVNRNGDLSTVLVLSNWHFREQYFCLL